jgi:hypothetical protein
MSMRPVVLALVLLCSCTSSAPASQPTSDPAGQSGTLTERDKIDRLISAIRESGLVFIRNGSEHSADDAADHLEKKRAQAGDRVATARDFIEHVAARSSLTGEPYLVRASGRTVPARDWLLERLAEIERPSH